MPSELKKLLDQIESERLACWRGLHGLASGSARHDFIQKRDDNIAVCRKRLVELVGDENVVDHCINEIVECADCLYEAEQWRLKCLEQEQIEHSTPTVFTSPDRTRLHRQLHDNTQIGDILLYKLRAYDQPTQPDRIWRGRVLAILTDCRNKRDYFVECLEPEMRFLLPVERQELIYSSQVYGFEPAPKEA